MPIGMIGRLSKSKIGDSLLIYRNFDSDYIFELSGIKKKCIVGLFWLAGW